MWSYLRYKQVVQNYYRQRRKYVQLYSSQDILNPNHIPHPTVYNRYLQFWNTRKISYFALTTLRLKPVYFQKLRRRDHNFFAYRELQDKIILDLRHVFSKNEHTDIIVIIKVMPGFKKFSLRAFF
jgi:hypothetical protein